MIYAFYILGFIAVAVGAYKMTSWLLRKRFIKRHLVSRESHGEREQGFHMCPVSRNHNAGTGHPVANPRSPTCSHGTPMNQQCMMCLSDAMDAQQRREQLTK
jgi:hypothetical protein